jgi:hypothetical protein
VGLGPIVPAHESPACDHPPEPMSDYGLDRQLEPGLSFDQRGPESAQPGSRRWARQQPALIEGYRF